MAATPTAPGSARGLSWVLWLAFGALVVWKVVLPLFGAGSC
jgi:hypothetical protein